MIRVNLLGTERARARTRTGVTEAQKVTLGAALMILATVGYMGWRYWTIQQETTRVNQEVANAEQVALRLKNVLAEVDRFEAYRAALTQRVGLIEQLRRGQTGPVHMLDEISRALPDRVWLVQLSEKANLVTIEGRTMTHGDLTGFVANLQNSDYFRRPVDIVSSTTETDPQGELVRFVIRGTFVPGGNAQAQPSPAVTPPAPPAQGRN